MWAGRGRGLSLARGNICDAIAILGGRAFCAAMRSSATATILIRVHGSRTMKTGAATGRTSTVDTSAAGELYRARAIYLSIGMSECTGDTRGFWCAWNGAPEGGGLRTGTLTARCPAGGVWLTPMPPWGMPLGVIRVIVIMVLCRMEIRRLSLERRSISSRDWRL